MRSLFLSFFALLALPLGAASLEISAVASKTKVELGEPFTVTLHLIEHGRHTFEPKISSPNFEGLQPQVQGPQSFSTEVNGNRVAEYVWIIELRPTKAGKLVVPAFGVSAKDPLSGETTKFTQPITITVIRPQGGGLGLGRAIIRTPKGRPIPEPPPEPDEQLGGLKPDKGLPWDQLGMLFGGFAVFLGFLGWMAFPRPKKPQAVMVVPRNAGQLALEHLEHARQGVGPGHEADFILKLADILRLYLRHRLALHQESTLDEAMGTAWRRVPSVDVDSAKALKLRLELLLYGDTVAEPIDVELGYARARAVIISLEQDKRDLVVPVQASPKTKRRAARGK